VVTTSRALRRRFAIGLFGPAYPVHPAGLLRPSGFALSSSTCRERDNVVLAVILVRFYDVTGLGLVRFAYLAAGWR
jgi:hypothetical protein